MDEGLQQFVATLADVCNEIAFGRYDSADTLFALTGRAAPPAAAKLAEAFGMMVVQLEAREMRLSVTIDDLRESQRQLEEAQRRLSSENATLKQEVGRLRIEIDQAKKEEEVQEITDTDYFRALRSKAQDMRRRAQK